MADIFISYSRKDSSEALKLAEQLRASGMEVWIDQQGLEAASQWSKEIVTAIEECKAFILLLSECSLQSENVVKEVSIASEAKRAIMPVEISRTELPRSFKYQLAGIQRAKLSDFEGIVRSLTKLGVGRNDISSAKGSDLTNRPTRAVDERKSLIVLPFEDLSPAGEDNGWFADGLAGEMIDALGHIKSLRILDRKTSIGLRGAKLNTVEIGKEFNTRYFIEGSVRKFGEQIKISVALLDIEKGDYVWQESHRGEFKDIFDIQESVAEKVVEGLKLHLTKEEKTLVQDCGTENAEAYELFLKANEYYARQTREGYRLAVRQSSLAIEIDPNYADALNVKAYSLVELYRHYDRNPNLLIEAERLAKRALEIKSDLWSTYDVFSSVYLHQGKLLEAEEAAREFVRRRPENYASHFGLGFFYMETNQPAVAIAPFEKSLEMNPDNIGVYANLVLVSNQAHDPTRVAKWSRLALPLYERRLRLVPDDVNERVDYANLLQYAGERELALEALNPLLEKHDLDGNSLYNIACLYARIDDTSNALETLKRSVAAGFASVGSFHTDPDLAGLRGTEEFQELIKELEGKANV
jgi:adenylate cyclase